MGKEYFFKLFLIVSSTGIGMSPITKKILIEILKIIIRWLESER